MADVGATLASWSSTTSSNSPAGGTAVGNGLDDNLRELQGVVVRGLSHKGSDVASATTTDIGATEGLYLDITGTTTITGFGTVRQGILKILQFDDALTVTHNATSLILKYGLNHLTTAGDVMAFVSLGSGNWKEVWRGVAGGDVVPGALMADGGATAPAGWLHCYGQAVSRTTYSAIFSRYSTTYGVGDGATTFNLPDLRGRVIAGQDDMGGSSANRLTDQSGGLDGDTLGDTGGAETHTLSTSEIPEHAHTQRFDASTGGGGVFVFEAVVSTAVNNSDSDQTTANAGGGGAHNNVQPTIILNWMIKT